MRGNPSLIIKSLATFSHAPAGIRTHTMTRDNENNELIKPTSIGDKYSYIELSKS